MTFVLICKSFIKMFIDCVKILTYYSNNHLESCATGNEDECTYFWEL